MGLQHAIHDVRDNAREGAGDEVAGAREQKNSLSGVLQSLTRLGRRLLKSSRGGRTSAWRVVALAIIVYVGALNLANFLVVNPVRTKLENLVAQKTVVEDFIVLRQSGQAVAGVRDALMRGDERVSVMTEIRQMASDAGMSVVGEPVMLTPREASKKMTEYPLEVSLKGDYHEVGRLIGMLESSPRLISVREVEIDARDASPSRAEVTILVGVLAWEE